MLSDGRPARLDTFGICMIEQVFKFDAASMTKVGSLVEFFLVVCVCAGILFAVYRRIWRDEPDSVEFASTIFILTVAIGLLVSIIKQAPAISFGLFGAMSIVRFRAQVKRPQRIVFVLMATAVGVCCGAGEYLATVVGTLVLSGLALAAFGIGQSGAPSANVPVKSSTAAPTGPRWRADLVPLTGGEETLPKVLVVLEEASREAVLMQLDDSFSGAKVADALAQTAAARQVPAGVTATSWPEFGSQAVKEWRKASRIEWRIDEQAAGGSLGQAFAALRRELWQTLTPDVLQSDTGAARVSALMKRYNESLYSAPAASIRQRAPLDQDVSVVSPKPVLSAAE